MRHLRAWWRELCLATSGNYVLNSHTSRPTLVQLTLIADSWRLGSLAQSLVRRLAPQPAMRALEIVELLPLLEPDVEELWVVNDHTLEHAVELFVVDTMRPLDLAIQPSRGRLDADVLDATIQDMPVESGLKL